MLVCFTFLARAGKEEEFEVLLNNEEGGKAVARAMGATRNALFLSPGRMVRIMEFPDGAKPPTLLDVARKDPKVMDFLRKIGPMIEDGFDVDHPETLEAFNRRALVPLAYDVRL